MVYMYGSGRPDSGQPCTCHMANPFLVVANLILVVANPVLANPVLANPTQVVLVVNFQDPAHSNTYTDSKTSCV